MRNTFARICSLVYITNRNMSWNTDWYVTADKPLLKYLSPIFKPMFRANHYWAMDQRKESLERELKRRRKAGI